MKYNTEIELAKKEVMRHFSRGPGCGPQCISCLTAERDLDNLISLLIKQKV